MSLIKGFVPLPIYIPASAGLPESVHYCYIKPHVSRNADELAETTRALFLVNPLPYWDLKTAKDLFSQVNNGCHLESVLTREAADNSRVSATGSGVNYDIHINLSKLTNEQLGKELLKEEQLPFGSSVITFLDRDGLELFLESLKKKRKIVWKGPEQVGTSKYSQIPGLLDRETLEKEVTHSLVEFQAKEKQAEEEVAGMRTVVDEDGFTLVVGKQRKTKADILGSMKKKADLEKDENLVKKSKKKEKQDFYRFQIRERKKQEMNQLLSKFKQDQEKIKVMREKRKFKPY